MQRSIASPSRAQYLFLGERHSRLLFVGGNNLRRRTRSLRFTDLKFYFSEILFAAVCLSKGLWRKLHGQKYHENMTTAF